MPTIDVYSTSGRKLKKMTLPKEIFDAKVNEILMAQVIKVYLANQRQAPAKSKRRGEITASGRKIYKQKGTGRARHGDRKAPLFVKGAKAHGPTGAQNYKLKLSRKMKKRALFSVLTSKLKDKEIMIVGGLEKIEPKTKAMTKIVKSLKLKAKSNADEKVEHSRSKHRNSSKLKISIILPSVLDNVIRAGKNISGVNLLQARQLNTYQVLNGGRLVFMKESIGVLKETFLKNRRLKN